MSAAAASQAISAGIKCAAVRVKCIAVCIVALLMTKVNAHELENGFVERSVAVVVRPGEAIIQYSIGANETTRQQLARSWSQDAAARETSGQLSGQQAATKENVEAAFLDLVGQALMRRLTVQADGSPVKMELIEVLPTPRHHVEATVVMRAELPANSDQASTMQLNFCDDNFARRPAADPQVAGWQGEAVGRKRHKN